MAPLGNPGTLISAIPIAAPKSAPSRAWRMRYVSSDPNGKRIVVTGTVFAPSPSTRMHDVVAWAHPTSGIVPACAPSLRSGAGYPWIAGFDQLLKAGFVVTATDYAGLGTAGIHPYLVGSSEARAAVDSVRAARHIAAAHASGNYIVWGHSQGGHTALWSALLSPAYAPEVTLMGVAAVAPPTDLAANVLQASDPAGLPLVASYLFAAWSHVYGVPLQPVLAAPASRVVRRVARVCAETPADAVDLGVLLKQLKPAALVQALERDSRWRALLARNSPGMPAQRVPYFIAQGTIDELIVPAVTTAFVKRLCIAAERVDYERLNRIGHQNAGSEAAPAAVRWMQARFAGTPAPSNC